MGMTKLTGRLSVTVLLTGMLYLAAAPAAQAGMRVTPSLLALLLQTAGLEAAADPDTALLRVAQDGLPLFGIGLPDEGLAPGEPFLLEIEGLQAVATFTPADGLQVVEGDLRIKQSGVFGMVACILSTVFIMVADILAGALTLDISGLLEAVFNGVQGILACVQLLL